MDAEGVMSGRDAEGVMSIPTPRDRRRATARALLRLAGRRAALAGPVMFVVSLAVFALGKASPFDPVAAYFGVRILRASPEQIAQVRANWGVDDPVWTQYTRWLGHLLTGDLGDSRLFQQPVSTVIGERLGWSVLLAAVGLVLAIVLSLVLGTLAAWRQGGWLDRAVTAIGLALEAAPVFWLALAALSLFAVSLRWLPAGGLTDPAAFPTFSQVAEHLVLPGGVLALSQAPWFTLFVRQALLESLTEDYVVGARARGLSERAVVLRHALRTALLPFLTLMGARVPELITGALLVETVFSWPGIAAATVAAARAVDFPLLAAVTLLSTVAVLLGNLLADMLYAVADPRVRTDG
jgi:peptide/nickel transport system permease protein